MGKVLIKEETLVAISDAIRAKTGGTEKILPGDWAGLIENASSGEVKGDPEGHILWRKKGVSDSVTEASGTSYTLTTPNATRPSSEIEYSTSAPVYNSDKKVWEFADSTIETLVNTDTYVPSVTNVYVRLTSAPNVWYYVSAFTAGALNTSGTCTKSMAYSKSYTAAVGNVVDYIVDGDSDKYPSSGWLNGYYYEHI